MIVVRVVPPAFAHTRFYNKRSRLDVNLQNLFTPFTKKSVARKEGNAMIDKIIMLLVALTMLVVALKLHS